MFAGLNIVCLSQYWFWGCVVPFEQGLNALLAFPLSLNVDQSQAADKLQAWWLGGARKVQPKLC